MDRNRSRLIWVGVLIAALALGGLVYVNLTSPAYACSIEFVATPTATPAPSATSRLGFVESDMGKTHAAPGTVVKYRDCPPASGNHYNQEGFGPIPPRVYGPNERALPEGWVHNMEHGALVLLYQCSGTGAGDGCSDSAQNTLRQLFSTWPASPICGLRAGERGIGPVMARFDNMAYPYAAVVWGQVLPLQSLDTDQVKAFWQQQGERTSPEQGCAQPSTPPSTAPSVAPTIAPTPAPASAAPSTSPAPAAS